jgi:hypothetical protein
MAEIVDDDLLRKFTYPWDEWSDGRTWQITRGEDFEVSAMAMRAQITGAATRRGMRAIIRKKGPDTLRFRFTGADKA